MFEGLVKLRGKGEQVSLTAIQINEWVKCSKDPIYFIENYVMIDSGWYGKPQMTLLKLEQYQKNLILAIHNGRFLIGKLSRQVGKSTALNAYAVWCIIFNDNYKILIAAHKEKAAKKNMKAIKLMLTSIPIWLQVGITTWNMSNIEFENGSFITAETTTEDSGRSGTYSLVILDEFAFVDSGIANNFYGAVYPTIVSSLTSKLAIISTPNGMNQFYDIWMKAINKKNQFIPIEIKWDDPPNRDEKFKQQTIENIGMDMWLQEFECLFTGSSNSLIKNSVLNEAEVSTNFEEEQDGLYIFEKPQGNNIYFIAVDCSRGREQDNSAFVVFDITDVPYKVVATYANNEISPMEYPNIIYEIAERYNSAFVLIELNDAGQEVADILFTINEYYNVLHCKREKGNQYLNGEGEGYPGLTTSGATKSRGCTTLRVLIENTKIIINDFRIKSELSNFTSANGSYKASTGNKDDLVMCLVIFAWATTQEFFKEISDSDIRAQLYGKYEKQIEEEISPPILLSSDEDYNELEDNNWLLSKEIRYKLVVIDMNYNKETEFEYPSEFYNKSDAINKSKRLASNYKFIRIIEKEIYN